MSRCRSCRPVPEEVRQVADLLERRWLLSVVYASLEGAVRFNEFRQALEGIPPGTLAERLRQLERAGVLEREVMGASPPYVEYRLTTRGRELGAVVEGLRSWMHQRAARAAT